jgi:hypothetical protein
MNEVHSDYTDAIYDVLIIKTNRLPLSAQPHNGTWKVTLQLNICNYFFHDYHLLYSKF